MRIQSGLCAGKTKVCSMQFSTCGNFSDRYKVYKTLNLKFGQNPDSYSVRILNRKAQSVHSDFPRAISLTAVERALL